MTIWGRFLLTLVLLAVGLAGVSSAQPEWLSVAGLGFGGGEGANQEKERRANLERRGTIVFRRLAAKRQITGEVLAGKVTLFQAAALFEYLNDTPDDCRDPFRELIPGNSDGEKLCRQVIGWVEQGPRARTYKPGAEQRVQQLEADLAEHLAQNAGKVVLPTLEGE